MRRGYLLKNSIAFVGVVVSVCCLMVIMISVFRLPEISVRNKVMDSNGTFKSRKVPKDERIGRFGEMMIEMLPEDLAFTVFIPSEKAFERDLKLRFDDSLVDDKRNDTCAIISRILGFSAIPRTLFADMVFADKDLSFDSISGFTLYILKDIDGMLVVNRIRTERVDVRRKDIVVHIMDGVIMDAEFEQSFQPDYTEEE